MSTSNYGICYEASRIYRNGVLEVARDRLSQSYGTDWEERVHRPFGGLWPKLVADANERRLSGELTVEIVDDLDYLGITQLLNLFDGEFDTLFPKDAKSDERSRRSERHAVMGWAREIRALRDPVSHFSERDLTYSDAFRFIDSARRVLVQIGAPAEAEDVERAAAELSGRDPNQEDPADQRDEPLEGYLPPPQAIAVQFVGRERQLHELHNWLSEDRATRWAVTGAGGVGKSAIAHKLGQEVRDRRIPPFEFVFWLSSKRRRFVEGSAVSIPEPDFTDLPSAVDFLLFQYGDFSDESASPETRQQLLLQLLNEFPALLIVDDVDSLEGTEEAAIEFFTIQVPSTKSRVLITSRRVPFGFGGTAIEVGGFEPDEGADFVQSRVLLYGLDSSGFSREQTSEILRVTDGSPLYIDELVRLCVTGIEPHEAVQLWGERGKSARQYALSREVDLLTSEGQDVLIAACIPDGAVSRAEIEAASGLGSESLDSAIRELQRLFLVPKPRLIDSEQRFELNHNTRSLVRELFADSEAFRRAQGAFVSLSGDQIGAGARRRRTGDYVKQAVALVRQDSHGEAEETLLRGLDTYPGDSSLLAQLGWVYRRWKPTPRVTDARETFARAYQLKCANAEMYRHWSAMESDAAEWSKAADAAEKGLEFTPDSPALHEQAGYAQSRLGSELIRQLQPRAVDELSAAWDHLRQAIRDPADLLDFNDRRLQSKAFRSLLITADRLCGALYERTARESPDQRRKAKQRSSLAQDALRYLDRWRLEHPDDRNVDSESARLEPKFRNAANPG